MYTVSKKRSLPYTREQMFALVNNIEEYPLFLPWCKHISVHHRRESPILNSALVGEIPVISTKTETKATMRIAKGLISFLLTTTNLSYQNISDDYLFEKSLATNNPSNQVTTNTTRDNYDLITIDLVSGPFKSLSGSWKFRDLVNEQGLVDKKGCLVDFAINFQFNNRLFAIAAEQFLMEIAEDIIGEFSARAEFLYGVKAC